MANKRGQEQTKKQGRDGVKVKGSPERQLELLERCFRDFWGVHQEGDWIPQTLRNAALEAIESGTPEQAVLHACGISRVQLNSWRECQGLGGEHSEAKEPKARVFPVIEDAIDSGRVEGLVEEESGQLQLRVGRWEISIRQIG